MKRRKATTHDVSNSCEHDCAQSVDNIQSNEATPRNKKIKDDSNITRPFSVGGRGVNGSAWRRQSSSLRQLYIRAKQQAVIQTTNERGELPDHEDENRNRWHARSSKVSKKVYEPLLEQGYICLEKKVFKYESDLEEMKKRITVLEEDNSKLSKMVSDSQKSFSFMINMKRKQREQQRSSRKDVFLQNDILSEQLQPEPSQTVATKPEHIQPEHFQAEHFQAERFQAEHFQPEQVQHEQIQLEHIQIEHQSHIPPTSGTAAEEPLTSENEGHYESLNKTNSCMEIFDVDSGKDGRACTQPETTSALSGYEFSTDVGNNFGIEDCFMLDDLDAGYRASMNYTNLEESGVEGLELSNLFGDTVEETEHPLNNDELYSLLR